MVSSLHASTCRGLQQRRARTHERCAQPDCWPYQVQLFHALLLVRLSPSMVVISIARANECGLMCAGPYIQIASDPAKCACSEIAGGQDLTPMSLGLSHSLSRYKLKFSPDKVSSDAAPVCLLLHKFAQSAPPM